MTDSTPTPAAAPAAKKTAARKPAAKSPAKPKAKAAKTPARAAKPAKPAKAKKIKLVRDSFTLPKDEYAVLAELKQRCVKLTQPAKKSELLRAGIKALAGMSDKSLLAALKAVPALKTGRPKQA